MLPVLHLIPTITAAHAARGHCVQEGGRTVSQRPIQDVAQVENPASEAVRREREESVTKFT